MTFDHMQTNATGIPGSFCHSFRLMSQRFFSQLEEKPPSASRNSSRYTPMKMVPMLNTLAALVGLAYFTDILHAKEQIQYLRPDHNPCRSQEP